MNYLFLDYDGFVCKAFYAAKSQRSSEDDPIKILDRLTTAAFRKAKEFFCNSEFKVFYFMSGHSWKKDEFPSYKRGRKQDAELGEFRDEIKDLSDIIYSNSLEADDLISLCIDYVRHEEYGNYLVISDDKDLRYISENFCKINIKEQIEQNELDETFLCAQMIAGDKEDNVPGIPKVGFKTALKLLGDKTCYEKVVAIYQDKGQTAKQTYENMLLIKPASITNNANFLSAMYFANKILCTWEVDEDIVNDIIDGEKKFIKETIETIRNEEVFE